MNQHHQTSRRVFIAKSAAAAAGLAAIASPASEISVPVQAKTQPDPASKEPQAVLDSAASRPLPFKKRMCWPFHEFHPDFADAELAACAKIGFNQALINSDSWAPGTPQLHQYCNSEVWPGLGDPLVVEFSGQWIKEQTERCRRHGLEAYIYLIEPLVPFEQFSVYAPQCVRDEARAIIPEECLGVRQYGSVTGRPLCISHPTVQAYYRTRSRELFRRFPLLKGAIVLSGDGRNEFCDTNCPRCAKRFKAADEFGRQMESFALLLDQLHAGANEVRSGIEILIENHNMKDRTFDLINQLSWPLGIMAKFSGEECYAAHLEPAPSFRSIHAALSKSGATVYAYHEFLAAEEYGLAAAFPDPFALVRQIRSLQAERVQNIGTFWGMSLSAETIKARMLRTLLAGNAAPEEELVREECVKLFGKNAASEWVRAFRAVSAATQIWMMRLGYHNLRQGFYGARFKIFTWPADFPFTFPASVPEGDWEWWWRICFDGSEHHRLLREANLLQMPRLLEYLDAALAAMQSALEAIPEGTVPTDHIYEPNKGRDSRWYGEQAVAQVALARELAESEMNMYRLAVLRDQAREGKVKLADAQHQAAAIIESEGACMRRIKKPLATVLAHHHPPQVPPGYIVRSRGNVEKTPDRWQFLPQVERKLEDIPQASERAARWLEKTVPKI